jgi:hypothetical protein
MASQIAPQAGESHMVQVGHAVLATDSKFVARFTPFDAVQPLERAWPQSKRTRKTECVTDSGSFALDPSAARRVGDVHHLKDQGDPVASAGCETRRVMAECD